MFKKIQLMLFTLRLYIRGKLLFLRHRFHNGELLLPLKYSHSHKSRQWFEYCLKIIENPEYTYETYAEQLLYEDIVQLSKELERPIDEIAFITIELMFGALGFKVFD